VSDPDYRDTIAHHIQLYGETEGLKSSLAAAYARLIIVVDSAVKLAYMPSLPGQPARCQSVAYIEDQGMYGMNDWLTRLKAYGADTCFDVASCWGYAWTGNPEGHAGVLQWVRNCLSDAGYAPRPCIFTEFGCVWEKYNPPTDVQRAFHLSKAYPVLEAANATPGYPALQGAWFTFSSQYMGGNWPIILDTTHNWQSLAPAYAYEQWGTLAKGADFEGRIPCGDSVFVLQFEDTLHKRFWTAWAADPDSQNLVVGIPARSDIIDSVSTQIDDTPDQGSQSSGMGGWLSATLDTVPLIIAERETLHRPDITVDSVWCTPDADSGLPVVFHAKLRNTGTDSTPISSPNYYLCTRVKFYIEGGLARQADYLPSIYVDSTVIVSADTALQLPVPLPVLVCATANEDQMYVELGMNDNAGYFRCGSAGGDGGQSGGNSDLPKTLSLSQPLPNPAKGALRVRYALPKQTRVSVKLYDVSGKLVTTVARGEQAPGYYDVTWDRKDDQGGTVARGVYFLTLSAEGKRFCRKVVLTK